MTESTRYIAFVDDITSLWIAITTTSFGFLFVCPFVCILVRSFVYLFVCLFDCSLARLLARLFAYRPSFLPSPIFLTRPFEIDRNRNTSYASWTMKFSPFCCLYRNFIEPEGYYFILICENDSFMSRQD